MIKNRKSGFMFLVGAVVCALIAALLTGWLLVSYTKTVDVLVVTRDVDPFEQVERSFIGVVSVPAVAAPSDAVFKIEDLDGKYTRFGLARETVVRESHLLDDLQCGPLAAVLSLTEGAEKRAFAIPLSETVSVGGAINKEDHIDLIASMAVTEGGVKDFVAKIIARNLRVIDVASDSDGASSLIVVVTPEQAEELAFLLEAGRIYAVLNPYDADTDASLTEGFYTIDKFLARHTYSFELPIVEQDDLHDHDQDSIQQEGEGEME